MTFLFPFPVHKLVSTLVDLGFWQTNSRLCLLPILRNSSLHRAAFFQAQMLMSVKVLLFLNREKQCCN